jgi:hypothetical protein
VILAAGAAIAIALTVSDGRRHKANYKYDARVALSRETELAS